MMTPVRLLATRGNTGGIEPIRYDKPLPAPLATTARGLGEFPVASGAVIRLVKQLLIFSPMPVF
jgi:hypothetical protein